MRQRCGPIQCVSIEDGSAMQEYNENTHAAPKLVNRPSPHTLPRPCDLGHGHGKTTQSGPTTRHNCPDNSAEAETEPRKHECAPENVIDTQRNCTFSYVSQRINTSENLARRSIPVVVHSVATHIDKDHQRQHVMGTAQDADKELYVRGREALRQNTRRTDASEHHLSASNPMRKKQQHKKFPRPTVCEHKTRPTRHMTPPQTNQLYLALRCVTSRYCTEPYTQT